MGDHGQNWIFIQHNHHPWCSIKFSHNVFASWNTIAGWKPRIISVSVENNGAWYIIDTSFNKFLSAFVLEMKIGIFIDIVILQ